MGVFSLSQSAMEIGSGVEESSMMRDFRLAQIGALRQSLEPESFSMMERFRVRMFPIPNKALQPTADGGSGLSLTLLTHSYHCSAVAELTSEVIRQGVF